MKQGSNSRRSRGRGNGKRPQKNYNFDSAGPEGRVRGNAQQIYEKYLTLARDAMTAGDRIATENYFQHAEHYLRVLMAQDNSDGRVDAFRERARFGPFGMDEFDEDGSDGDDEQSADGQPSESGNREPQGNRESNGNRESQGNREAQGNRDPQGERNFQGERNNQGEGRPQRDARPQREGQRDGQFEGRPRGEGRPPRNNRQQGQGRAPQGDDVRAEPAEGGRGRGNREGSGNGRRVPIETPSDQDVPRAAEPQVVDSDHDIADDDGVRRTIAI